MEKVLDGIESSIRANEGSDTLNSLIDQAEQIWGQGIPPIQLCVEEKRWMPVAWFAQVAEAVMYSLTLKVESSSAINAEKKNNYINRGYDSYINENKKSFPQAITIRVDQWSGQSTDGSNEGALHSSYNAYLEQRKNAEVNPPVRQ